MPNITISLDDRLLKLGRAYTKAHHTSVNALIRKLLSQTIENNSQDWMDECFKIMDRGKANSNGSQWQRGDLYDV